MKTLISLAFLSMIAITTSAVGTTESTSQLSSVTVTNGFKFFRAHRQGPGVALSWANMASDVVSFKVERSYDGEYFDVVSEAGCNGNAMHKFADNDVFPGIVYYRIIAVKANGAEEISTIESVRIVRRG